MGLTLSSNPTHTHRPITFHSLEAIQYAFAFSGAGCGRRSLNRLLKVSTNCAARCWMISSTSQIYSGSLRIAEPATAIAYRTTDSRNAARTTASRDKAARATREKSDDSAAHPYAAFVRFSTLHFGNVFLSATDSASSPTESKNNPLNGGPNIGDSVTCLSRLKPARLATWDSRPFGTCWSVRIRRKYSVNRSSSE